VRKWAKHIMLSKDLTRAKQQLKAILDKIRESNEKRLEILAWKVSVCLILFEIISGKIRIERVDIIKLLKSFKNLKK
jgi:hypothetical protein